MELANFKHHLHTLDDVYVLGSGATLTYVDPEFFTNKIIVATNTVADRLGLYDMQCEVFTHTHYHDDALELASKYPGHYFFAPQGDRGFAGIPNVLRDNIIYYQHQPTKYDFNVDDAWHDKGLIVGSTSMHGSMHLAAYMGAANIILAGADCGTVDGESNHAGYKSGNLQQGDEYSWLARWEKHLREVKARLVQKYGVRIYSLNPWVNLNLEGHTWQSATANRKCTFDCADLSCPCKS